MRRAELAPFVFTPPPTGKRRAELARVLKALKRGALPVSPPRSRAQKRKPEPEVWLLPLAEPGKPAAAPKGMRVVSQSTGGALTVYEERRGRRREIAKVEVGQGDTVAKVAQRVVDAINAPPTRLELLRKRAQALGKTISGGAAPDRAVSRSATAGHPRIADLAPPRLKSETARLLAADPQAQRIARGLEVRGWGEATSARYSEEVDDER